jgi:CheY-like chemotaxis protein
MATILLVDCEPLQAFRRKDVLERRFRDVQRVCSAAEAFCLIEQPGFADSLALVIAGGHMPGTGGPAFVSELLERIPGLPILVLGARLEKAGDYPGDGVCFRPGTIRSDELLSLSGQLISNASRFSGAAMNAA